jgi:hypothetical protein
VRQRVQGSTTEWQAFAFAERTALQWPRRSGDPAAEVRALRDHLAAIIPTIPDVHDIEWDQDEPGGAGRDGVSA